MMTTAVIAFREFLEAFLIVGVFLGISRKLKLKKEFEISLAALLGIIFSLLLSSAVYVLGDRAHTILNEENAEYLEGYLLVFSGLFIAYVVFSLHNVLRKGRGETLIKAHKKMQQKAFDISLFFTILLLVIREGFEIALFTASTSLFSAFMQNIIGLLLGFVSAIALGAATFLAYIRLPIGKVFRATEYMIIVLGASLVQHGISEMVEIYLGLHISDMLPMPLNFLPHKETLIGHLLQSMVGIDRDFSFIRLTIMGIYVGVIYLFFLKRRRNSVAKLHG